ncbi:MAG TPA: phosphatidate cytidylyltransferase [Treponema sp.]|nr:phosphatidate cytidylyltransferase [Treponema sp.]
MRPFLRASGVTRRQYLNDIKKEVFRKSIHICSAALPFLLRYAYAPVLVALATVVVLYSLSELCRLHGKPVPLVSAVTAAAARKRDENKFVLGPVTLACGIIATALLWKPLPASIGIYALAFGDGLASLSGKLFGRVRIPLTQGKTAAGSLTCFAAIFVAVFAVTGDSALALVIASAGMFIELLPLKDLDNIVIPVVLGGLAQFIGAE